MDHEAYHMTGSAREGPWLITCDHASNAVPLWIGPLGVSEADMERHIAYDVGAQGVALALGEALNSPVICSKFSRLVIDPNRGEDDPTLIMQLYDGTIIPANRALSAAEREARLERLYRPYHAICARRARGRAVLAIHSFTPCLQGRPPRPWHIGVLHSPSDSRLAMAVLARLRQEPDLCIGDNQPYQGHLPGDSIDRHALAHGRLNTLIELRNDLIAQPEQQKTWAQRLAPILAGTLSAVQQRV